jgi:hypothetical protein
MPIEYYLIENKLTENLNDYRALVTPSRSLETADVIRHMIERGSTITRADILGVLEDFYAALQSLLELGASVNTDFSNFSSSIRGVFTGITDPFDQSRHQITPVVNPGKRLRAFYRSRLSAVRVEPGVSRPVLLEFTDYATDERNSLLTPGGLGSISGHRLKIDTDNPDQGIFFLHSGGTEYRAQTIADNKPSRLIFLIPAGLLPGEYTLEVRTDKKGQLQETLTVAG